MNFERDKLKIHFIYVVIILSLALVMLGGILLVGFDDAVKSLSNGATLLSIVLAVVAILITLWDVAGHKNNVAILNQSVKHFKRMINDFEKISDENGVSLNELRDIITELNEKVTLYESKFSQIESYIKEGGDPEVVKELKTILDNQKEISLKTTSSTFEGIMVDDVLELVRVEFNTDVFSYKSFFKLLKKHYPSVPASMIRAVISGMVKDESLEEVINYNDGGLFYKLID
ncbi:hypothetical protein [Rossellomorea aquimaris]|uniref:Uncharacterized protein n=1 Tax=Rossellomorea aquimaris TaxID=189382 RepID=A0A1J6WSZ7_9BACI|nr:hypothetical protein [Rossellomorea aquimaris]OIU71039.1 hypothetical protein BHE18_08300 [Rossellomorea aquimaris]